MRKLGYQALGFGVWTGAKVYMRRRFGDRPRKIVAGVVLVASLTAIVAAQRKAGA